MSDKDRRIEFLELHNRQLIEDLAQLRREPDETPMVGCTDNHCVIRRPKGMGTNGGCKCHKQNPQGMLAALMFHRRRGEYLLSVIEEQRATIAELERELSRASAK